jgi:hypothetical protein
MTREQTNLAWALVAAFVALAIYAYYTDAGGIVETVEGITGTSASSGQEGGILWALSNFENDAASHNNPGAICGSFDADGNCLGPETFPTLDAGIAAAENLINKYLAANPLITVSAFVKKWSGASGAVLSNYTNSVANDLGISPDDPISDGSGVDDLDD